MRESDYHPSELEGQDSPLHPLDVMKAEAGEYEAEERIDDQLEEGATYGEIVAKLGGPEEAERIIGSDYAQLLQEMAAEELEAAKGESHE